MNFCYKTNYFALIFILSNILVFIFIKNNDVTKKFKSTLDVEKKQIYDKITNERMLLYLKSFFIGILLSLVYIFAFPKNNFLKPKNLSKLNQVAISLVILYLGIYFSYILYPKSDYMVLHLDNEMQKLEWLKVYKYMQFYYHLSFVLGFIGISLLYYGLC